MKKDTPSPEVRQNYFKLSRYGIMNLSPCTLCSSAGCCNCARGDSYLLYYQGCMPGNLNSVNFYGCHPITRISHCSLLLQASIAALGE